MMDSRANARARPNDVERGTAQQDIHGRPKKVVHDVACTICGCVCDDLTITIEGSRITQAQGACTLAEPWLLGQDATQPPGAQIDGVPSSFDEAMHRAVDILRQARAPLIYGLSRSSTAGQRAAVRLADRLGATIDTTASRCHAPSIMAIQQVGESTCSLGETKNRADLVIFWGSNPQLSHPRHFERYSVDPVGLFVPGGRRDRHVAVVDVQHTATVEAADSFVQVGRGRDFEAIWALRALVRGETPDRSAECGAPMPALEKLAEQMKTCRSGIVFFGLGLTRGASAHNTVEALLRLVWDLNHHTRFYARRMRVAGDVAGADSVLCWQTGYPFSVNLARGYPRYNPGEYSANEVLLRSEADACVLVGSEGVVDLSAAAVQQLKAMPTIALDYPSVPYGLAPTVGFRTAVYGVHLPGTAYRMDETPIPLRAVLESDYPSDADVLQQIESRLASTE